MRLITTTIRYDKLEDDKAKELYVYLGNELVEFDGVEKAGYSDLVVTVEEYFKYWEVLDKMYKVREVWLR